MIDLAEQAGLMQRYVPGGATTAFLAGSLVEGFGNESSDLDVLIVHPDGEQDAGGDSSPSAVYDGGADGPSIAMAYDGEIRADLETWATSRVQQIVGKLEGIAGPGDVTLQRALDFGDDELVLCHALTVGYPITGHAYLEQVRATCAAALPMVLVCRFLAFYTNAAEDAAGGLGSGDVRTARLTSQHALDHAVDAYLASRGATNPKPKWRFRRMELLGEEALSDQYLAASSDPSTDHRDVTLAAKGRLRLASTLSTRAHGRLAEGLAGARHG